MVPTVFYVGFAVMAGVILAFVILELGRPWPTRQARIQKKLKEAKKAKRHAKLDEIIAEARERDLQAIAARELATATGTEPEDPDDTDSGTALDEDDDGIVTEETDE